MRGAKEDVYLKAQFGEQWERFAKQVPYRYIPGIC
jgi:protein-S-isoprenylcysteine O-methyltransferase Ste14